MRSCLPQHLQGAIGCQRLAEGPRAPARQVRALVVTPTRELAAQVHDSAVHYGAHLPLRAEVVFGGVKINPQIARLKRGCDILVATPGRLLDLHQQGAVAFDALEVLVLDEADRMLDMGFIHDVRRIVALLPTKRQTLMFSATFSQDSMLRDETTTWAPWLAKSRATASPIPRLEPMITATLPSSLKASEVNKEARCCSRFMLASLSLMTF